MAKSSEFTPERQPRSRSFEPLQIGYGGYDQGHRRRFGWQRLRLHRAAVSVINTRSKSSTASGDRITPVQSARLRTGIAVDPSNGELYVDNEGKTIERYSSTAPGSDQPPSVASEPRTLRALPSIPPTTSTSMRAIESSSSTPPGEEVERSDRRRTPAAAQSASRRLRR